MKDWKGEKKKTKIKILNVKKKKNQCEKIQSMRLRADKTRQKNHEPEDPAKWKWSRSVVSDSLQPHGL